MGIRDDIQSELTEAFNDDLADVVSSFDLVVGVKAGPYDVDSDSYPEVEELTPSRGMFEPFGSQEVDGTNIKFGDEKIIIIGSEIAVSPEIDQIIRLASGTEYSVIRNKPVLGGDSVAITYEVQVRLNK